MSRLRRRVVLILLALILVVAAILFGLLTYTPDLFGPLSSSPGSGVTGQMQQLAQTGFTGSQDVAACIHALSLFATGRSG